MSVLSGLNESASLIAETYASIDPSVLAGYTIFFNREVILFFFFQDEADAEKRIVRVRILEKKDKEGTLEELRIEISTEKDLAFSLECIIGPSEFLEIQQQSHLRIEFHEFANSVADLLKRSVENAKEYQVKFIQGKDYGGSLAFYQTLRLRAVEVFRLAFVQSSDEFVRNNVQYRFNKLKVDLMQKTQEFEEQMRKLESKNPSLARHIRDAVENAVKQQLLR
jgi:hypothetical protein